MDFQAKFFSRHLYRVQYKFTFNGGRVCCFCIHICIEDDDKINKKNTKSNKHICSFICTNKFK